MKGPGEDGEGGVTFRPGWQANLRNLTKPWHGSSVVPVLGYGPWAIKVTGGITPTQWLTTLTGESPTSSRATLEAERVTRADKAQSKRPV